MSRIPYLDRLGDEFERAIASSQPRRPRAVTVAALAFILVLVAGASLWVLRGGRDPDMADFEVVQNADLVGSTEFIIKAVREAPAGSKWAIGTEFHLVNRLADEHPEQQIVSLSGIQCACATMYRIDPPHLLWALENLVEGRVVNPIRVSKDVAEGATTALERMLALKGDGAVGKRKATMAG